MKCHKCGFEYNGNGACPKCGANAIMVNEDYLRRKREYEESGKVSMGNITLRKSDNADDLVEGEDIEEEQDPIVTAYKKMREKAAGSVNSLLTAKGKKKPSKNTKKKESKQLDTKVIKKGAIMALLIIVCVLLITGAVNLIRWFINRPVSTIYALSGKDALTEKHAVTLITNDAGITLVKDNKKTVISDKKAENIRYNDDYTTILFVSEGKQYVYCNGKGVKEISVKPDTIVSEYIGESDSVGFVTYTEGIYTLSLYLKGKGLTKISEGNSAKELIYVSPEGRVLYSDIDYSPINGVNSMSLKAYIKGDNITLTDKYSNCVVFEKLNEIIFLTTEGEAVTCSLASKTITTSILDDVRSIFYPTDECVYAAYGNKVVAKEYGQCVVLKTNDSYTFVNAAAKYSTIKIINNKKLVSEIIYSNDKNALYYVEDGELKDAKGNTVGNGESFAYNEKKNELICADSFGNIKEKNITGVDIKSIRKSQDGDYFVYEKSGTTYICSFGKKKSIKLSSKECKSVLKVGKYIYFVDENDNLNVITKRGKRKYEKKIIYKIHQKV